VRVRGAWWVVRVRGVWCWCGRTRHSNPKLKAQSSKADTDGAASLVEQTRKGLQAPREKLCALRRRHRRSKLSSTADSRQQTAAAKVAKGGVGSIWGRFGATPGPRFWVPLIKIDLGPPIKSDLGHSPGYEMCNTHMHMHRRAVRCALCRALCAATCDL
jgi:hypothetical protein